MKYPMTVKKKIPGLVDWQIGRQVDATISMSTPGEYSISPRGEMGPTTVCVPYEYLQIDKSVCTDPHGYTSHDIIGDNCIRCGKYFA